MDFDPYEGIIYKYNNVKFSQIENDKGEIPLKFTYDIIDLIQMMKILKSDDFRQYIGDILVECVEEQLKNEQLKIDE